MAEPIDPDLLVGAQEIADRLGVAHMETVHNWRRRYPDFPQPVAQISRTFIWYWPDVERWNEERLGARADSDVVMTFDLSQKQTMSIAEVARVLGLNEKSVRRAIARDEFPLKTVRIGRQLRLSRAAVEQLLRDM